MNYENAFHGNPNLIRKNIEFEYEPWQIEEIIKCKNDPIYFIKTYIKIINLDKGLMLFELYDFQEKLINLIHNENRVIAKCPRQVGKTQTVSAYFCHYIIFNSNKNVAILGNKDKTAREILYRIKTMFENLPNWLKPGVIEWNKSSVELENGSRIITSATSSSAVRGQSMNAIFLDEFAFISTGVFEDFFQSVYPTISSSKNSKIIMVSTPWGLNHFYKFWTDSVKNRNGFKPFSIEWNDVPGRDEEWKEKTINELASLDRWKQEYEADFLGSSNTLIDSASIKNMTYEEPISIQYFNKFKIFDKPIKSHNYVLICDVSEGVGGDFSTVQVLDVAELPYTQVAVYKDNTIKTHLFAAVINEIAVLYNGALVIVENNAIGESVLNALNYSIEYDNIFFSESKFGLRMTKSSKNRGCSHLKHFIESNNIIIKDLETINEFSTFIRYSNGTFAAEKGKTDDLITPLILFSFFMQDEYLVESWLSKNENDLNSIYKSAYEEIENELLPFGWINNGIDEEFCE